MAELVKIGASSLRGAKRKVYIKTFGCQMNEYDSAKVLRILQEDYDVTESAEAADLVVLNTCSVRDKPEQKLYSMLGELRELKQANPDLMVGVGGCVAQQEGERIVKRSSVVDFVFGTHNLSLVPALINQRRTSGVPQVAVDYRDEWEEIPAGFVESDRVSVFISISRGCNKNCTYCIVPRTRGTEVSRPVAEIEREVKIAAHRGVREVVLLGQTVNSYGIDLSPRIRFSELVARISKIEGIERIRFTSPHPQEVRDDFIQLMASNKKVCRHIHLPLQSGSDRILKLMNRNYRRKRYLEIVAALRESVPDLSITTDIIVGFPQESEEDFLDTMEILEICRFDSSYSFMFSPRPGTVAATLPGQIPYEIQLRRLQQLQARQDEITTAALAGWVGRQVEVLIDAPSTQDPTLWQGRTSQNITLNLLSSSGEIARGDILPCLVKEAARFTLRGGGRSGLSAGGQRWQFAVTMLGRLFKP